MLKSFQRCNQQILGLYLSFALGYFCTSSLSLDACRQPFIDAENMSIYIIGMLYDKVVKECYEDLLQDMT